MKKQPYERYIKRAFPKMKGVVSMREWKTLSPKEQNKYIPKSEARAIYTAAKNEWYGRYKVAKEYKKEKTFTRIMKSGREIQYTRERTYRTYRDTLTGKYVSRTKITKLRTQARKEYAIHKIAEKRGVTLAEAREHFANLEESKGLKFIFRHYADTPK